MSDARVVSEERSNSVPGHVVASVVSGCRRALNDYQAGLTDDVELRRALGRAGLAVERDRVWLLDLSTGRRWELEGVANARPAATDRPAPTARLRQVVDDLATDFGERAPLADAEDVPLLVTKGDRG